jgi:hypothetical protein
MASINKLVCDHCDHEHIFISNKTYVILEDGSEKRWPEPGGFQWGEKPSLKRPGSGLNLGKKAV